LLLSFGSDVLLQFAHRERVIDGDMWGRPSANGSAPHVVTDNPLPVCSLLPLYTVT